MDNFFDPLPFERQDEPMLLRSVKEYLDTAISVEEPFQKELLKAIQTGKFDRLQRLDPAKVDPSGRIQDLYGGMPNDVSQARDLFLRSMAPMVAQHTLNAVERSSSTNPLEVINNSVLTIMEAIPDYKERIGKRWLDPQPFFANRIRSAEKNIQRAEQAHRDASSASVDSVDATGIIKTFGSYSNKGPMPSIVVGDAERNYLLGQVQRTLSKLNSSQLDLIAGDDAVGTVARSMSGVSKSEYMNDWAADFNDVTRGTGGAPELGPYDEDVADAMGLAFQQPVSLSPEYRQRYFDGAEPTVGGVLDLIYGGSRAQPSEWSERRMNVVTAAQNVPDAGLPTQFFTASGKLDIVTDQEGVRQFAPIYRKGRGGRFINIDKNTVAPTTIDLKPMRISRESIESIADEIDTDYEKLVNFSKSKTETREVGGNQVSVRVTDATNSFKAVRKIVTDFAKAIGDEGGRTSDDVELFAFGGQEFDAEKYEIPGKVTRQEKQQQRSYSALEDYRGQVRSVKLHEYKARNGRMILRDEDGRATGFAPIGNFRQPNLDDDFETIVVQPEDMSDIREALEYGDWRTEQLASLDLRAQLSGSMSPEERAAAVAAIEEKRPALARDMRQVHLWGEKIERAVQARRATRFPAGDDPEYEVDIRWDKSDVDEVAGQYLSGELRPAGVLPRVKKEVGGRLVSTFDYLDKPWFRQGVRSWARLRKHEIKEGANIQDMPGLAFWQDDEGEYKWKDAPGVNPIGRTPGPRTAAAEVYEDKLLGERLEQSMKPGDATPAQLRQRAMMDLLDKGGKTAGFGALLRKENPELASRAYDDWSGAVEHIKDTMPAPEVAEVGPEGPDVPWFDEFGNPMPRQLEVAPAIRTPPPRARRQAPRARNNPPALAAQNPPHPDDPRQPRLPRDIASGPPIQLPGPVSDVGNHRRNPFTFTPQEIAEGGGESVAEIARLADRGWSAMESDFPEYLDQHIGRGEWNADNFQGYLDKMSDAQYEKFVRSWKSIHHERIQAAEVGAPSVYTKMSSRYYTKQMRKADEERYAPASGGGSGGGDEPPPTTVATPEPEDPVPPSNARNRHRASRRPVTPPAYTVEGATGRTRVDAGRDPTGGARRVYLEPAPNPEQAPEPEQAPGPAQPTPDPRWSSGASVYADQVTGEIDEPRMRAYHSLVSQHDRTARGLNNFMNAGRDIVPGGAEDPGYRVSPRQAILYAQSKISIDTLHQGNMGVYGELVPVMRPTPHGARKIGAELWGRYNTNREGSPVLNMGDIEKAQEWASSALGYAAKGAFTGDASDDAATINKRISEYLKHRVDQIFEVAKKQGVSEEDLRAVNTYGGAMKQTAEGYINKSGIFRTMGLSDDPANPKYFDIAKEAKLQKTADDLKAARAGDSVFDAKFAKAFGDDYEAALSGPVTVMSGEGGSYSFGETSWGMGGGGRGRGRGPGGGDPDNPNLWGGSVGRFLYSAYIAKRLWSMTAAPAFADMEYYQKSAAEFGPASHYGQSESMDMTMGPGSSYARSQAVRAWSGEGVYSVAGGFGDLAYGLTDNKGLSRALAAGKIIGGLGAASYVLSSGIPAMLGMGSVAAAAPAIGGLAIGAGVGYLALEGYNAITGDDVTPVEVLRAVTTDIKERQYRYDPRRREEDWAKSPRFMSWAYPGDIDKLDVTAVRDTIEPIAISSGTTAENVLPLWYQMQNAAGQKLLLSPRKVTDTRASQGYGIANPVEGDVTVQEAQTSVPGVLDLFDKITAKASTMGMSGESLFNAGASIAEGEGFLPGTPDYMLKAAEYALLDEDERARQEGRTSRKRSAAASLAQYMRKGWRSALPFVQGLGEDFSEAELRAPMSVFDLASQAGANLEDLDSALYPTDDTGRRFTFRSQADVLFERSMDRGGIQTQRDVGVANALMERGFSSFGGAMYAAEAFGIDTPEKLSSSVGMLGAVSQYRELDQLGMLETLGAGARMTPYRASMAQSLLPQMARAGMSMPQMTSVVSGIGNMNDQDLYRLTREASGDLQYMSYQTYMDQNAYRGFGMEMPSLANRFYDQTGAPIFQSDFRSFMGMLSGQSALGNLGVGGTSGYWSSGTQAGVAAFNAGASPVEQAAAFFGSNDTQAMQAWAQNGAYGRTQLHAERMYGFQMAGIGLQLQGIALEQDFLWGGGTPTSPGQGSMWWFQDRQRSMQHKSTMADFSAQKESMERQNRFAEENAALSWERMGVTQSYQRDTFSMNWAQMRQQQEWTREDWQHQDTMRSLNYGWQQEDFDEALRTSTGRERKQILRQQDRAAITHNLEEGQIETQRGRQEELWKQEEDRFERQVDYSEKLMELDREGFEQSQSQREEAFAFEMSEFERRKREYLEQKKLQDQIIAAEREYKVAQMELQKQSAGIAAAAAAEQREYNQQIEQASDVFGRAAGYAHSIAENDPSYILRVLANFTDKLQNVSATNINNLGSMFTKLNYTTVGTNAQRIAGLVGSIDTVSLSKIQAIIRLLSELGGL